MGVQDAGRLVLESALVLVIRHVKMVAIVAADHVLIIVMDALAVAKLVELLVLIHAETVQEIVQANVTKLAKQLVQQLVGAVVLVTVVVKDVKPLVVKPAQVAHQQQVVVVVLAVLDTATLDVEKVAYLHAKDALVADILVLLIVLDVQIVQDVVVVLAGALHLVKLLAIQPVM